VSYVACAGRAGVLRTMLSAEGDGVEDQTPIAVPVKKLLARKMMIPVVPNLA